MSTAHSPNTAHHPLCSLFSPLSPVSAAACRALAGPAPCSCAGCHSCWVPKRNGHRVKPRPEESVPQHLPISCFSHSFCPLSHDVLCCVGVDIAVPFRAEHQQLLTLSPVTLKCCPLQKEASLAKVESSINPWV